MVCRSSCRVTGTSRSCWCNQDDATVTQVGVIMHVLAMDVGNCSIETWVVILHATVSNHTRRLCMQVVELRLEPVSRLV